MVAIDLIEYSNIEEKIETLTFRNSAYVKILKTLRETSFSLGVDIIIRSIDYNLQEDSKTEPPLQFYGFATLVFQDCLSVEIPIRFPRQRIYYDRQWEAFRQWRHWIEFYQQYQFHRKNDISLASIMGALEIPYEELESETREIQWIELPLREVLFKGRRNCQFELEFTRWQPIPFVDPITGSTIGGESNQEDGDKDDGLPKDGSQPKQNSPSSPFAGNPPPTSIQEAGQKGFGIEDPAGLSETDYPSGYEPDSFGYFLEITVLARFTGSPYNCDMWTFIVYFLVPSNVTGANIVETSRGQNCPGGSPLLYGRVTSSDGSVLISSQPYETFSARVIRSPDLPANQAFKT